MIFYKKKSCFKKIIQKLSRIFEKDNCTKTQKKFGFLVLFKGFFLFLFSAFVVLYVSYLFFIPIFVKEEYIESYINSCVEKNSTFKFNIDEIKIYPDYKFDISIKAKKANLMFPNDKNFVSLNDFGFDINIINIILKKPLSITLKAKDVTININYKKNYDFINCLKPEFFNSLEKNKINDFKISFDNFKLNLFDENVKKNYVVEINSPKITKTADAIEFYSKKGKISSDKRILDFDAKIFYVLKNESLKKIGEKILSIDYNPFLYADKYNFYAKSTMDIKISSIKKKNNIQGKLLLEDCTFDAYNIKLPKNSLLLDFKGDKVFVNCDFNLIKNQFIKISSKIDISKNKYIEANIKSNDINLSDLTVVLKTLLKIIYPDYNYENYDLKGILKVDLNLISDFKTVKSSGILNLKSASFISKKPHLVIDNINSDINFSNNKINIVDTSCYFDKAKFYIKGNINSNTDLNLEIESQKLPISSFLDIFKKFIFDKDTKNIDFKQGDLQVKSKISGNLKNPVVVLNGNIDSFKIYLKDYKTNVRVQKIDFSTKSNIDKNENININLKDVNIHNSAWKVISDNIRLVLEDNNVSILNSKFNFILPYLTINDSSIEGSIKDYKNDNRLTDLTLKGNLKFKNKSFIVDSNSTTYTFESILNIKNDRLSFLKADLFKNGKKHIALLGDIDKISSNNPVFNNFKILTTDKIKLTILEPYLITFNTFGSIDISNTFKNPKINGLFDLTSLSIKEYAIFVENAKLNIKDSLANLNVSKGKMADIDFSLISDVKILNNGIIVNNLSIASDYINYSSIEKYLKNNVKHNFDFEILNLKGEIKKFLLEDITLSSVNFEGNYKNSILNISKYKAELYNGTVEGSLNCNLNTLKVKLNSVLKGINVRYFSTRLKEYSLAISGNMSALIDVDFIYSNTSIILKTLEGYIKFNIDEGELNHFAKLERFLHAGNVLSHSILKLNLNSAIAGVTKHNTGYFKTIEGTIKIKDTIADIQYIKTQGINMSMYLKGTYNLLSQMANIKILGIIPTHIAVSVGDIGKSDDALEIKTSHIDDIKKIPALIGALEEIPTRLFSVVISGDIRKVNSIKVFRWID